MITFAFENVAETPTDYRNSRIYGDVKLWQFSCYEITVKQASWLLCRIGIDCSIPDYSYCRVTLYKGIPWLIHVTADYSIEFDLIERKLRYRTDDNIWAEWF